MKVPYDLLVYRNILYPQGDGYKMTDQFRNLLANIYDLNQGQLVNSIVVAIKLYCPGISRDELGVIGAAYCSLLMESKHDVLRNQLNKELEKSEIRPDYEVSQEEKDAIDAKILKLQNKIPK